jgi:hypothetical protein
MAKMTVGGRPLDLTKDLVEHRMRNESPEPIREHLVEMLRTVFPPKQVLATVTGWDRQSFTTMEAQRVLTKVGFVCRRPGAVPGGREGWIPVHPAAGEPSLAEQVAALRSGLVVAQEAIAGLSARVTTLEAAASS